MPRQTLTAKLRERIETCERIVAERREALAEFNTPSRKNDLRAAEHALELAREDLAALVPTGAAPDMDMIRAVENAAERARDTEMFVKRGVLLRLLADVMRASGGGTLPAVWKQIHHHLDQAMRYGSALDIRFERDPTADAVHATLPQVEDGQPPRIVITVPEEPLNRVANG